MMDKINSEDIKPLIGVLGIFVGFLLSTISTQLKYRKDRKMTLKALLAELLKMQEVIYGYLYQIRHSIDEYEQNYWKSYLSFCKKNYNLDFSIEDIPHAQRINIRNNLKEEYDLIFEDYTKSDWENFTKSLVEIKSMYPFLYFEINKEKYLISYFKEIFESFDKKYNEYLEAQRKAGVEDTIPISDEDFRDINVGRLEITLDSLKDILKKVSKKINFLCYVQTLRVIWSFKIYIKSNMDFSPLEPQWKKALDLVIENKKRTAANSRS